MSAAASLENIILIGALIFKSVGILNGVKVEQSDDGAISYIDATISCGVGYLLMCAVGLVALSASFGNAVRNCRKGLGGSVYVWLLPAIHLDALARTPVSSTHAVRGLYSKVVLGYIQVAVVLSVSIWAHMAHLSWKLLLCLLAFICTCIHFGSSLSSGEHLTVAISCMLFLWMLFNIFNIFPHTFSFGEGVIICQACSSVVLYLLRFVIPSIVVFKNEHSSYDFISAVSGICLVSPAVVYTFLPDGYRSTRLYYYMSCGGLLLCLYISLTSGHLQSIVTEVVSDYSKVWLLVWWMLVVVSSVSLVVLYNLKGWAVTTVDRKYFHLQAVLIFVLGIVYSPHLTKLASIGALIIFVILEFIRWIRLPYYGEMLDTALRIFLDKRQDSGSLIMTHIYLLSGCALPLWITSSSKMSDQKLSLCAGVISLGIGDTCASVIGSRYGRLRYPGSQKTVEGTLAAWLSMVVFSYLIAMPSEGIGSQA